MSGQYTFGDTDLAAERLALVAEIFDPISRAFLQDVLVPSAGLALDLGCGPGHTTRLLAEVCRAERTLGLDRSAHFVDLARSRYARAGRGARAGGAGTATAVDADDPTVPVAGAVAPGGGTAIGGGHGGTVEFGVHDVTTVPLPEAPADVVHARLLLAHLPDPLGLVARWRTQLRPGGVLVLDEIESMDTPAGPLRRYEDLVVALVAAEGGAMYAGPLLAGLGGRRPEVDVADDRAARMYGMNLATWRHEARRRALATDAELDRLAADLAELAEHPRGDHVHWVLRQVAVPAEVRRRG